MMAAVFSYETHVLVWRIFVGDFENTAYSCLIMRCRIYSTNFLSILYHISHESSSVFFSRRCCGIALFEVDGVTFVASAETCDIHSPISVGALD